MKKRPAPKVYVSGPWRRLWQRFRGHEVIVLESPPPLPILVLRHPRTASGRDAAESLRTAWAHLLSVLHPNPLEVYADVLQALPPMVVVQFQDVTPGGCLGLARPRGLESPATKSLAAETGLAVGEIDLAWQLIAEWQPRPLASMALPEATLSEGDLHYRIALLTVLFHELEHLAFPDRPEREVRGRSDALFETVLRAVAQESGNIYGIAGNEEEGR